MAQAIIVLAYYLASEDKKIPVTYETASTRRYKHGRTENIRVLSEDGHFWAKSASNPSEKIDVLVKNLENFTASHLETAKNASFANALDRHLFGLMKTRKDEEEALEKDLFQNDKIFMSMFQFDMSTSNMSPGNSFQGLGFGTLTPSGYGVNYCISASRLLFSISAWEHQHTDQRYPMFDCPRFDANGQILEGKSKPISKEWYVNESRAQKFKRNLQKAIEITRNVLDYKRGKSKL